MIEKWELVDSRVDKDYRIFKVRVEQARSPRTGKVNEFYTLESGSWVNVIPDHPFRGGGHDTPVPARQPRCDLEIPGGLVEDEIRKKPP